MKIGIVGGGASGFFCAINTKLLNPSYHVFILEKSSKLLTKVEVSGGGRCNVTNAEKSTSIFANSYPRGSNYFKKVYSIFNNENIITWFKNQGVELIAENDNRIFPKSNSSKSIIDCFIKLSETLNIEIIKNANVQKINIIDSKFNLETPTQNFEFDKVVICSGGANNRNHYQMLHELGHKIIEPLPSLFTFNLTDKRICELMGLSVKNVLVKIQKTKLENTGDLLITHWGLSGPAIIKLSAFAAQVLHEAKYEFDIKINWINITNENIVREQIDNFKKSNHLKTVFKYPLFDLPLRLWEFLCSNSDIKDHTKWAELSAKSHNKLIDALTNTCLHAKGKTTFKEEFVTCGGVSLDEINIQTMESKIVPNLFFAGEVIDIDGITGGFNFQNAWSTAYVAANNL